ncbi:MAG: hypothetical protein ACKOEW_06750 [Methylocystis sp.]
MLLPPQSLAGRGSVMKEAIGATGVFLYFATLLFGALLLQF